MTQYFSDKIRVLSFFCILFVLYAHSMFHDYPNEIQGMTFNLLLQEFIGKIRCGAVPLFFAISGYLYFRNIDVKAGRRECYGAVWTKMKKRCRTLVVPYIIACLFPVAFYLVLEQVPAAQPFINNGGGFSENFSKTVPELLYFIYVDSGNGSPYAFQLWFLRDLIVIVALSPIILMFKRLGNRGGYCLLAILFVVNTAIPSLHVFFGMFWFLFGDCFLSRLSKVNAWPVLIVFIALCVAETFYPAGWWKYVRMVLLMLGLTAIWTMYDKIVPQTFQLSNYAWLGTACSYTFFIYLYHMPTMNIIRKLIVLPFGHTSFGFAFAFLVTPLVFAAIWILVGMAFRRLLPGVYAVCMGGRTEKHR